MTHRTVRTRGHGSAHLVERRRVGRRARHIVDAALALDREFLAMKIHCLGNLGALVSFRGVMPPVINTGTVVGTYTTPALHVEVSGILTTSLWQ
jgi:hypothetical protein